MLAFLAFAELVSSEDNTDSKKVSVREVLFDSPIRDIVWLGTTNKILMASTRKGKLFRSEDSGTHWDDLSTGLARQMFSKSNQVPITSIDIHPLVRNYVIVSSSEVPNAFFLSEDAGNTFYHIKQKFLIHSFLFHPTKPRWALISVWTDACKQKTSDLSKGDEYHLPCQHVLYLTRDSARTFELISSYIVQFSWGHFIRGQEDSIYMTQFRHKAGQQPTLNAWTEGVDFVVSRDHGKTFTTLVMEGNKFLVSNSFIFVAQLKKPNDQTVGLLVSTDGGRRFDECRLPVSLDAYSYTVLDTSEGTVMLHVNHSTNLGEDFQKEFRTGNVYLSGADGISFSLSLPNNIRSLTGDCEFDRVESLFGVYIANFMYLSDEEMDPSQIKNVELEESILLADSLEWSSKMVETETTQYDRMKRILKPSAGSEPKIRSVISFDKGGTWSYILPPKVDSLNQTTHCDQTDCWLHLHSITSFKRYAPFYSSKNALGIVMGTGNIGTHLKSEPDLVNTYISRDGGLTWAEAHKGAFSFEFGDHGGLIVMADDIRSTNKIIFSWDEGASWFDFDLGTDKIEVDNIITDGNNTGTQFLLYGSRGDSGVVYHLDFDSLAQPICQGLWSSGNPNSDYEPWIPNDGRDRKNRKCLLGRETTYIRRKQKSTCFNGQTFQRPMSVKPCECSIDDYTCELGFSRKVGADICHPTDLEAVIRLEEIHCTSSGTFNALPYRKVVGDACEGGWSPEPVILPCPPSSKLSTTAIVILSTVMATVLIYVIIIYASKYKWFRSLVGNYGFETLEYVRYTTLSATEKPDSTSMDFQTNDAEMLDTNNLQRWDVTDATPDVDDLLVSDFEGEQAIDMDPVHERNVDLPRLASPAHGKKFSNRN